MEIRLYLGLPYVVLKLFFLLRDNSEMFCFVFTGQFITLDFNGCKRNLEYIHWLKNVFINLSVFKWCSKVLKVYVWKWLWFNCCFPRRIIICYHQQFSTSVESRTEIAFRTSVRLYVRTMPLILANSYQITSILHMVLSTVTVSVFIEEKNLNRPSSPLAPAPFLGYFGGVFLRNFGA